jgi:hypothetical protein
MYRLPKDMIYYYSTEIGKIVNQNLEPKIVFIDYYHMLYNMIEIRTKRFSFQKTGDSEPIIIMAI